LVSCKQEDAILVTLTFKRDLPDVIAPKKDGYAWLVIPVTVVMPYPSQGTSSITIKQKDMPSYFTSPLQLSSAFYATPPSNIK